LSKKAVLEGAGLIDLFFKDVEKKKNDSAFLAMMEEKHGVSFFEKAIGNANLLFNYILGLNKPVEDVVVNKTNTSSTIVGQNNYSTTTNTKTASSVTTKSTNSIATTKPKITTTTKVTTTTKPKTTTTTKPKTTTTTKPQNLASKCNFVFGFLNQSIYNKKVIFNEIA
jgi:cell division septation protein DedD